MRRTFGRTLCVAVALLAAGACSNVLGIEDAVVDPTYAASGGSGGADAARTLCDDYCDAVMANCVAPNAQYTSRSVCMKVCATLAEGGDVGNTVNCRLDNARKAGEFEPEAQCPFAGPGGNGRCGSNCEGYCTIMDKACKLKFTGLWVDVPDCVNSCSMGDGGVPELDGGGYDITKKNGDSLQCRLYHVSAATADPGTHCVHAAGESTCVN